MHGRHITLNIVYSKDNIGYICEPITRYMTAERGACLNEQANVHWPCYKICHRTPRLSGLGFGRQRRSDVTTHQSQSPWLAASHPPRTGQAGKESNKTELTNKSPILIKSGITYFLFLTDELGHRFISISRLLEGCDSFQVVFSIINHSLIRINCKICHPKIIIRQS